MLAGEGDRPDLRAVVNAQVGAIFTEHRNVFEVAERIDGLVMEGVGRPVIIGIGKDRNPVGVLFSVDPQDKSHALLLKNGTQVTLGPRDESGESEERYRRIMLISSAFVIPQGSIDDIEYVARMFEDPQLRFGTRIVTRRSDDNHLEFDQLVNRGLERERMRISKAKQVKAESGKRGKEGSRDLLSGEITVFDRTFHFRFGFGRSNKPKG